jgi:multidrug efflux pump subunit AcrA (membrane-fusion protein)
VKVLTRNRKIAIAVASVIVLGAAVVGLAWYHDTHRHAAQGGAEYFCPMHPTIVRDKPGECPICGMKLEKREAPGAAPAPPAASPSADRRILFYRHPMDPSIRSDKPAKDDMGMDYVPVYAEEERPTSSVPDRAPIKVPPQNAQLLGIRSEPVGTGFKGGVLRTVGRVAVAETGREAVHAKYEGYVEKLYVNFTGKPVRQGQPLLGLYSPEIVAAQKEYLVARGAQARLGDSSVPGVARGGAELAEAARLRLRAFDVSPDEIAALERTGTPRRTITVRSPISGVVVEKTAVEGMRVSPADRLYEIANLSRVWILADVYEKDLGAVRVGLPARVTLAAQPGAELRGTVTFVSPTVKPDTRTAEARIEVDNPAGVLKPDMFADVSLEGSPAAALTVPESAVIPTGERTLVFVDKGNGQYEPREVALGARTPSGYEVRRGLVAGERVVVSANFLLDSESSLRAAIARAAGGH